MSKLLKKKTVVLVKKILEQRPDSRDDDTLIQCMIWAKEKDVLGLTSANQFLSALHAKRLTPPESIRRTRQKLQELYPELRGKKYKERQEKLEPQVRSELKNFKK